MIKYLRYLRNKYILTLVIFGVYMLFLDDVDVFSIFRQQMKYNKILTEKVEMEEKLVKTRTVLNQLNNLESIEKFAREEKMFKRDDEDIFVIVED
jgi:cell division protein DivIC